MPFVRSARGTRSAFSSARVAATFTQAYQQAHGRLAVVRWRQQIQRHTAAVLEALRADLGEDPGVEWPRIRISEAISQELARSASFEVQEAHFDQKPPRPTGSTGADDPVWSVQRTGERRAVETTNVNPLAGLGETIRRVQQRRKQAVTEDVRTPARRSDWLAFWHALSKRAIHALDWPVFSTLVEAEPADLRHQTSAQWWRTWQALLDRAVLVDPRLYALSAAAEARRARAGVVGGDWLDGSRMGPFPERAPLSGIPGHEDDRACESLYRQLAFEHLDRLFHQGKLDPRMANRFDLQALCDALDPRRDRLLDWRGWQQLTAQGCLWLLEERPWTCFEGRPAPGARELPQWAFLRLAMAMSVNEDRPTERALALYQELSSLSIIPSETLLREGGMAQARYLEDQAARIPDQFEAIQAALYRAAVGTKWTGTVTLDWRAVRAKGAMVAGRRRSHGVGGFLRAIDLGLQAQGRQAGDRPVTAVLPLWHLESLGLLDPETPIPGQLQAVLAIPDVFFQRMRAGEPWFLFDPDVFPEVLDPMPGGYLAAVAAAEERQKSRPTSVRKMSAARIWRQILRASRRGAPFLLFEDAQRPFTPFPQSAPPVAGIDGVGALPCLPTDPEGTFRTVAWPSAAVNLALAIAPDGTMHLDRLRASTIAALRLLDNALEVSGLMEESATWLFRPVCLGAIGLYEAIENASAQAQHDSDLVDAWVSGLAEAWAVAVMEADQELALERGAAPAWGRFADRTPFDPLASLDRLAVQRQGARALALAPRQDWGGAVERLNQAGGHRCSVRTVWAPFLGAAAIAGVTPGGIGTLQPFDQVMDEEGHLRLVPTPFLLHHVHGDPERMDRWRQVMQNPRNPKRWPDAIRKLVQPDRHQWERRLQHAALIRPWIDQGVSVTLPTDLPEDLLHFLISRAWWLGLNSIRFAAPIPDPPQTPTDKEGTLSSDLTAEGGDQDELIPFGGPADMDNTWMDR